MLSLFVLGHPVAIQHGQADCN